MHHSGEAAVPGCHLQQQPGRLEGISVARGQCLRPVGESLDTIGVDALVHTAGMRGEADAHDGADIAIRDAGQDTLLHDANGLQDLGEEQTVPDVLEGYVDVTVGGEGVFQPGPGGGLFAILVIVIEARSTRCLLYTSDAADDNRVV